MTIALSVAAALVVVAAAAPQLLNLDPAMILCQATTPGTSDILSEITTVFTQVVSWVGTVFTMIWENKLLFIVVTLGIALIAIGVVRRLMRL